METTDILYVVDMNKAQEWVRASIRDGDVKMLSITNTCQWFYWQASAL